MMKIKSNQTRTYDGDGYKKRAACLCFRNESEEEVLLIFFRVDLIGQKTNLWKGIRIGLSVKMQPVCDAGKEVAQPEMQCQGKSPARW